MLADMTDELQQVLRLLEGASVRPASCVAIVSDRGCSDESTMLGTRDSFLHLAHELVSFVARSDAARLRGSTEDDDAGEYDPERCEFSSGSIRRALYEFPSLRESRGAPPKKKGEARVGIGGGRSSWDGT